MTSVTDIPIVEVAIADIVVGERRREKRGKLQSLQHSIQTHGLIHPILLCNGNHLVTGGRRLEACRRLDWKTIPARHIEKLTDEQLRAIELDENTEREALSDYAASKARLAVIRQAEAEAKAEAEATLPSCVRKKRPHRKTGAASTGRPKKASTRRAIAESTGIPDASQRKTERHVALAEQFPFLQRPGWVQHSVIEAGTLLDKLPETDQRAAAALLDQPAIPPKDAIGILNNLAHMPAQQRKAIFRKATADDPIERRTALTMAAKLPAPPDPGLLLLGQAVGTMKQAARECRVAQFKDKLKSAYESLASLDSEFSDYEKERRNAEII